MQHTHFPYFLGSVAESVEVFQVGALGSYPLQGQKLRGMAGVRFHVSDRPWGALATMRSMGKDPKESPASVAFYDQTKTPWQRTCSLLMLINNKWRIFLKFDIWERLIVCHHPEAGVYGVRFFKDISTCFESSCGWNLLRCFLLELVRTESGCTRHRL